MRAVGRLGAMRARAETLMGDTFTAYAASWTTVDGLETVSWTAQYVTPGKIGGTSVDSDTAVRTVTVGGVEREVLRGALHIPMSTGLPEIDWEFVCTAVGASSDASLLGRRWRVVDVPAKSYATARRLDVVEVTP